MLSYQLLCVIFAAFWLVIFIARPDIRRPMLLVSACIAPLGPASEFWFLRDYWVRETATGFGIGFEDIVFAFFLGGITFGIGKVISGKTLRVTADTPARFLFVGISAAIIVLTMLVLTNIFGINSIFSSTIAFLCITLYMFCFRPDLIGLSLTTATATALIFIVAYNIVEAMMPGTLLEWCLHCNPTGMRMAHINLEELVWDASWGAVGGILYEFATGNRLESLRTGGRA